MALAKPLTRPTLAPVAVPRPMPTIPSWPLRALLAGSAGKPKAAAKTTAKAKAVAAK